MNTQMHERYIHPTLVCVALYTILSGKKLWVYVLLSIVVFLNLELVLRYTDIPKHTLIFNRVFLSIVYFGILCILTYSLTNHYKELKTPKTI